MSIRSVSRYSPGRCARRRNIRRVSDPVRARRRASASRVSTASSRARAQRSAKWGLLRARLYGASRLTPAAPAARRTLPVAAKTSRKRAAQSGRAARSRRGRSRAPTSRDAGGRGSAIDPLRGLPREALPALNRHLDVARIDLHAVAGAAEGLRSDERGAGARERVVHRPACPEVIADRDLREQDRLLGRVVLLLLAAAAHDHLRARHSPDRGLVPLTMKKVSDAGLSDDPA